MKIAGLIQTASVGPLVELAVNYALSQHVDEVYLIHHSQQKGEDDFGAIKRRWENRLLILDLATPRYLQQAAMNVLITLADERGADWVYPFDHDEILLNHSGIPLKSFLASVPDDVAAVRYPIVNWVAPNDLDPRSYTDLTRITHRAVTSEFMEMLPFVGELLRDELIQGTVNFFEVPFPSKVLLRCSLDHLVEAGSHHLVNGRAEINAPAGLEAAHIPFAYRESLDFRMVTAGRHLSEGQPAFHGWQSGAVAAIAQLHALNEFWSAHSTPFEGQRLSPQTERDLALSEAFEASFDELFRDVPEPNVPEPNVLGSSDASPTDSIRLDHAIVAVDRIFQQIARTKEAIRLSVREELLAEWEQERVRLLGRAETAEQDVEAERREVERLRHIAEDTSRQFLRVTTSRSWRWTVWLRSLEQRRRHRRSVRSWRRR
jgi:hypothetical protein